MVFFILSLIALEGLAVVFPILLQNVALAASDLDQSGVIWWGVAVLGFIILIFAVHFLTEFLGALYADKYQANIREALYKKFNKLTPQQIEEIGASRILPMITNDSNWIKLYHRRLVILVVFFPVAILGSFIMLFTLSWVYALFAFASVPIVIFFFWLNLKRVNRVIPDSITSFDEYFFSIKEGIVGAKEIRILGKANERSQDFETHVRTQRKQGYSVERSFALSAGFNAVLFTLITIGIIIFTTLTNRSTGETIAIVQLNTAIQYINRVWGGSHMLFTWFIDTVPRCAFTFKRLSKIYNMPEQQEQGGLKQIPVFKNNHIKFTNVGYKQSNGKTKLENIDLEISESKSIAIAGGIESGKSLIAEMLVKMTTPTEGQITFNEIDIEQINSMTWRHGFVSYCPSAPKFIPNKTIRDNFKLLAPDVTDEQIMATFKELGATSLIRQFDDILDIEIKEGTPLTDGMKNLLSIVRGILKPAQIYVFNQCFEHVRHSSITKLMGHMKRHKKTAVFMTYDGSVCKSCDTIYVLNKGTISGVGTHASLIKSNKDYRELHSSTLGVMVYEEEKVEQTQDQEINETILRDESMPEVEKVGE